MANPTTYFGWVMPNSADLVTDLPADFNVFGQGVDTSMQYLLGGTTGQILSKTSGTNMAFTWINNDQGDITAVTAGTGISGGGTSGAVTITNSMATEITAKGDLIAGTGSATFDNLPVGTNGQTLVADSTASTGLKWATAASGGGMTLLSTTTLTGTSVTISSISGSYKHLLLLGKDLYSSAVAEKLNVRFNADTGSVYSQISIRTIGTTVSGTNDLSNTSYPVVDRMQTATTIDKLGSFALWIYRYTDTDTVNLFSNAYGNNGTDPYGDTKVGRYDGTAAITSLTVLSASTMYGTVYLYGVS
jgi:hypothetical protein